MKKIFLTIFQVVAFILLVVCSTERVQAQGYPFTLPAFPYSYNAIEPNIDARTMEIHYTKHHAAYVNNLNSAVKAGNFEKYSLDELMLHASKFNDAVRNNAGGHYNHSLFWGILSLSNPFNPQSEVGKEVLATFGSLDSLNRLLSKAGASRFGSGWAWLYVTPERKLAVCSSPNQDNPIMDVSPNRGIPILGIDVWEHAYYLNYQNRRGDYLSSILEAINWTEVNNNYLRALKSPLLQEIKQTGTKKR